MEINRGSIFCLPMHFFFLGTGTFTSLHSSIVAKVAPLFNNTSTFVKLHTGNTIFPSLSTFKSDLATMLGGDKSENIKMNLKIKNKKTYKKKLKGAKRAIYKQKKNFNNKKFKFSNIQPIYCIKNLL